MHAGQVELFALPSQPIPFCFVLINKLTALPRGFVRLLHADDTYYYVNGRNYVKQLRGYVQVRPNAGLFSILPAKLSHLVPVRTAISPSL